MFLSDRKEKVIPQRRSEDRKSAGTNSGQSGMSNLEVESIKSREESTGECVKLKTVTDRRQSNERNTFIAESIYLVLNSLRGREPEEKLKQRFDVVSFFVYFFFLFFLSFFLSFFSG